MQVSIKSSYFVAVSPKQSAVGTVPGYGLDDPEIVSRWWARFSAPLQTGPVAHPASCTMGTGSFPGGKERPGRDADPSPSSSAVVMKERAIPLLSPWAVRSVQSLSACTGVTFAFTFTFHQSKRST